MLTYFCNSLGALGYTSVYLPEASSPVGTAYKLPVDGRSTCNAYLLDELTPIIFLVSSTQSFSFALAHFLSLLPKTRKSTHCRLTAFSVVGG